MNTVDSKPERVVVLGIDAADRNLILRWAEDGSLPTFASLMRSATWGDSRNATGMVAGTVWPTFYTGIMPGRTGRFRGTTQFVAGTYEHADIDLPRDEFPAFWDVLSDNGVSSMVIDAPYAFLSAKEKVTQLVDWCSHSAWKDGFTVSRPESMAADVKRRFGRDPIGKCDFARLDTVTDFADFRDKLIQRMNMRVNLTMEMLQSSDLDLLFQVFSECHCAGHQLWHLHDEQHPMHDPELLRQLGGDPLKAVYKAMDDAVGRLISRVGDDATVLVFCSHGIGPAYTGTHLLDEVLLKLEGLASPKRRQGLAQSMVAAWTQVPRPMRTLLTPLQKLFWPKLKSNLVQPGKSSRKYFEIIVNDASAGIRLNVAGREPAGIVDPGAEFDEICEMLEREISLLTDPTTGLPLSTRVIRTADLYKGDRSDRLPDLLVLWSRAGPISEAYSPTVGRVSHRFVFKNHRTGDHTEDDGLFFMLSPGSIPQRLLTVSVADFAPTIGKLMGFDIANTDGRVIDPLVDSTRPESVSA